MPSIIPYRRMHAVQYALTYAMIPNFNYDDYNYDCANFVSQSLSAGGFPPQEDWRPVRRGSSVVLATGRAVQNWTRPKFLSAYFKEKGWGYWTELSNLIPGDVIFIGKPDASHCMMVTGKSTAGLFLSARTNSRIQLELNKLLKTSIAPNIRYMKIKDIFELPENDAFRNAMAAPL